MSTQDVTRTQAPTGLSPISFASLCVHALWRMAYADEEIVETLPETLANRSSALEDSHFQALLSKIEALSATIEAMNASLYVHID
jgi:hypothetical protein